MIEPTYAEVFCGEDYKRASWVGLSLFVLTQFTFVDVVFMYSNTLLTEIGMSEVMLTFLISLVNFITAIIGLVLLNYAGRRTLILLGNASMAVSLILLGISIQ